MITELEVILKLPEAILKIADRVREQGKIRFKSGAYTLVREHFEVDLCTP
jgi:hypothetical protein